MRSLSKAEIGQRRPISEKRFEIMCEAKARQRVVRPKPLDAKRSGKVNWRDPVMRAKLAEIYDRARGDHEKATRILGVCLGSGRWPKGGI